MRRQPGTWGHSPLSRGYSEPLTAASRAVNKGPPVLHLVDIYEDRLEVGSHPVPVNALIECAYRATAYGSQSDVLVSSQLGTQSSSSGLGTAAILTKERVSLQGAVS
jgi:hypothetical protein